MKTFKTNSGLELPLTDIKGKDYLLVPHRVQWFRHETSTEWSIETEFIVMDENYTVAKAVIKDPKGRIVATGHKREDKSHFQDHMEKAESSAVGRALAFLGYGTSHAIELLEETRIVDSPLERKKNDTQQNNVNRSNELPRGSAGSTIPDSKRGAPNHTQSRNNDARTNGPTTNDDHGTTRISDSLKSDSGIYTGKTFKEILEIDSSQEFRYTKARFKDVKQNKQNAPWLIQYLDYASSQGVEL